MIMNHQRIPRFAVSDLIRINQLVRSQIDLDSFNSWYEELPPQQRRELTSLLCEFAHQAGVTRAIWEQAAVASGVQTSDPLIQPAFSAAGTDHSAFRLFHMIEAASEDSLPRIFRFCVYLFGIAEGRVYRRERKLWCNHWWHRDLLDKRVVDDLLSNPQFYMTSMKDDDRIKGRWWAFWSW